MVRQGWIAIAAGALVVAVLLLVVFFVLRVESEMTPEDLARQWVARNVHVRDHHSSPNTPLRTWTDSEKIAKLPDN